MNDILKVLYNNCNDIRVVDFDLDDDNYIQIDIQYPEGENEDFIEFFEIHTINLNNKTHSFYRLTPEEYRNLDKG